VTELVEIPVDRFDVNAFENFRPERQFSLGNARALMWASQPGYETGRLRELQGVLNRWGFGSVTPFVKARADMEAAVQTSAVCGERDNAVILVFGGTDPGIWETVATDANIPRTEKTDVHSGFQAAFDVAAKDVDATIQLAKSKNKRSLSSGTALAAR
jgi:hypothetical protein